MFPYSALWFDSGYIFMSVYRGLFHVPCRGAEAWSHGPDCSSDHEIPQLLHIVVDALVVLVEQVHFAVVTQRLIPMI